MKSAAYPTAQWKYSPSIVPAMGLLGETLLGPLADIHGDDVFALFEYFPNFLYWCMKEMPQSRCSQLALPRELLRLRGSAWKESAAWALSVRTLWLSQSPQGTALGSGHARHFHTAVSREVGKAPQVTGYGLSLATTCRTSQRTSAF